MEIKTPPGYTGLVALDKDKHEGLGVVTEKPHAFAANLNAIYVLAAEFVQAARHYPVVFAKDSDTGSFMPLAITGLTKDGNLFVGEDGSWEEGCYVPAFVRRWPFFGVRLTGDETKEGNILICVDESGLEKSATPVFDKGGNLSDAYEKTQTLIAEMEGARPATEQLCKDLHELGLLEPFEAHAFPKQGKEMRLRGMFRVNESKLNELTAKDIKRLMKRGELSRIYAHLMSLDNFKFLMDRAGASQEDGQRKAS